MNKKGFTLVELMVVIVIIGVLAAVAIPKFSAATNKAKASEFPTMLSQIVASEEANFAEVNQYIQAGEGTIAANVALNDSMGIDIASNAYFGYGTATDYSTTPAAQTFTASAVLEKTKLGDVTIGATASVTDAGARYATGTGSNSLANLSKSYFN